MLKRILPALTALLLALCLMPSAMAESCFTIDVDVLDMDRLNSDDYVARELTSSAQGVRVRKYISPSAEQAAPIRLTLTQMDSRTLMFDKDYGFQGGTFDSGVIYLPYVDDRTIPYLVTLYVGDYVYAMPYMQRQARLTHNGACTEGVRMRDLSPALGSDWLMGTMVDLSQLRQQGSRTVDVIASNSYVVGQASLSMSGSSLRVDLAFDAGADVEVNQFSLYVITDVAAYVNGQRPAPSALGEWVDVGGAQSALVYLPMQLSYDSAGLPAFDYSPDQRQIALFEQSLNGASAAQEEPSWQDGGWSDDSWDSGWDSGWSDGWSEGSGWDDGWNSGADGWLDGSSGW